MSHTAAIFRRHDIGAIVPGRRANLVAFKDLVSFQPHQVWRDGVLVAQGGRLSVDIPDISSSAVRGSVRIPPLAEEDLRVSATSNRANIIDVIPDQIVTNRSTAELPTRDGLWQMDPSRDIAKLVVIERHGRNGNNGKGFVHGFGMTRGALASTVAHDSHNLICLGMSDADMLQAIRALADGGGGLVVVEGGRTLAYLSLPIAGLMSDQPARDVVKALASLHEAAKTIGCRLSAPFMALSFLALPVIPHLKLTDRGLVDVDQFRLIDVAAS